VRLPSAAYQCAWRIPQGREKYPGVCQPAAQEWGAIAQRPGTEDARVFLKYGSAIAQRPNNKRALSRNLFNFWCFCAIAPPYFRKTCASSVPGLCAVAPLFCVAGSYIPGYLRPFAFGNGRFIFKILLGQSVSDQPVSACYRLFSTSKQIPHD
jgi:hypothetical protein